MEIRDFSKKIMSGVNAFLIGLTVSISGICAFASKNETLELEVNRRNFVNISVDSNEITLIVHYPGGSPITNVCGFQLRTNISGFSNSHTEAFNDRIEIVSDKGKKLVVKKRVAEPPYFELEPLNAMSVTYKVKTLNGKSLRQEIIDTALERKLKFTLTPEIVVLAKHCGDKS